MVGWFEGLPEQASFRAISLVSAVEHLTVGEADQYLQKMYSGIASAEAEVCLMYAFAELAQSERSTAAKRERLQRALNAVNAAFPKARSEWMQKHLRAVQMFLEASVKNRRADPDLLYRAGLPRLATTSGQNPIDALRTDAIERIDAMAREHEHVAA